MGEESPLKPLHDQQTLGAQPDQREGARHAQPAQHQTLTQARYCGIAMSDFNGRKIGECRAAITAFRNRAAGVMSSPTSKSVVGAATRTKGTLSERNSAGGQHERLHPASSRRLARFTRTTADC